MATLKLTERAIAGLAPAAPERVQEHYWDTELKGFCVVVGARLKTFVVVASVRGKKRRVKIGVVGRPREDGEPWTVALARKRAHELLGEMATGIDPNAEQRARRGGPTLRDGLELHVANMRKKNRSQRSIHTITTEVPRLLPAWIDLSMVEMHGADLVAVHNRLSSEGKPFLANRIVAHVSAIWNALDRVYELDGRNPARAVTRNRYDPKRERVSDEGLPAWFERVRTLTPVRRDLQLFTLFTGMRSDAARRIRWADLDWKRGALRVPKPKGGESRAFDLPLSKTCLDVLKRRQNENAIEFNQFGGDAGWVFPSLSRSKPFRVQPIAETKERRVNESTGERENYMPGLHTLRRTFLSVAVEAGVGELDRHVLANHAFGRQSVNATYIAQAFPHLDGVPVEDRGGALEAHQGEGGTATTLAACTSRKSCRCASPPSCHGPSVGSRHRATSGVINPSGCQTLGARPGRFPGGRGGCGMSKRLRRVVARPARSASRAAATRRRSSAQAETEERGERTDSIPQRWCPLRSALTLHSPSRALDPVATADADFHDERNPVRSLTSGVTLDWAKRYLCRRLRLVRDEHETALEIRRMRKSLDVLLNRGRLTRRQRQRLEHALAAMPLATRYTVRVHIERGDRSARRRSPPWFQIEGRRVEVTTKVSVEDEWQKFAELVLHDDELAAILLPEELKRSRFERTGDAQKAPGAPEKADSRVIGAHRGEEESLSGAPIGDSIAEMVPRSMAPS